MCVSSLASHYIQLYSCDSRRNNGGVVVSGRRQGRHLQAEARRARREARCVHASHRSARARAAHTCCLCVRTRRPDAGSRAHGRTGCGVLRRAVLSHRRRAVRFALCDNPKIPHIWVATRPAPRAAITEENFAVALDLARQSDERRAAGAPVRPLEGLPISVKDNYVMAGFDNSCGLATRCFKPSSETGAYVQALVAAGAIPSASSGSGACDEVTPTSAAPTPPLPQLSTATWASS